MLTPATAPRDVREARMMVIGDGIRDARVSDLPRFLGKGDVLVVNDAATMPASLHSSSHPVELRLAGAPSGGAWEGVLFGEGDWRARTEDRPAPPALEAGTRLRFAEGLSAVVSDVSPHSPRLVHVRFDNPDDEFWPALYRAGRPVQYSYLRGPLELWDVQNAWAARPWAAEPASAGWPLSWDVLLGLRRAGVAIATLTHSAGLSSTGDAALDARLPLEENYDIPAGTVEAIAAARRVVAVGTTVVRALEGCFRNHGALVAGAGRTTHLVDGGHPPRVVDALFTGMHEPGTSHRRLMEGFLSPDLLDTADAHAVVAGYLGHEFGDSCLLLPARQAGL